MDPSKSTPALLPMLRLGLVQFRPRKASPMQNAEAIRELVRDGTGTCDILVFPEASLSGYFLEGGVREASVRTDTLPGLLGVPPDGAPDLVLGFFEEGEDGLYNSTAYLTPGEGGYRPLHLHRKTFLPNYGIFQERRFLQAGDEIRAFDTRFGRLGMLICEELWHSLPSTLLALDGAQLVLVASASPARGFSPGRSPAESVERWEGLASATASEHGIHVAVCQLVGSEGGKMFPGSSVVVGPDGRTIERGGFLEEGIWIAPIDGHAVGRVRARSPLLADLRERLPALTRQLELRCRAGGAPTAMPGSHVQVDSAPAGVPVAGRNQRTRGLGIRSESNRGGGGDGGALPGPVPGELSPLDIDPARVEEVLIRFLRDEVRRRGFEKVVIGVSGGVDSAVTLFLAARALGAENVHAFCLPYRTSSPESLEHARLALQATGVEGRTLDLTAAVDGYVEQHAPDLSPLRRGNIAARLRAVTLFDQAARVGGLPLGTGNKSERLLGYFTWHADDSPPINPLGDLFKVQVWQLARHLGVPGPIVEKPASADLVQGVHDEDELGIDYPRADLILHGILEGYAVEELIARGFPRADVDLVRNRLDSTHWKRELPTVAVLSSTAIGAFYLRPVDY